jgi:hypothetical protein
LAYDSVEQIRPPRNSTKAGTANFIGFISPFRLD